MKLMKNMTTSVVLLSMTAQLAFAAPGSQSTITTALKNYRASVEGGTLDDKTATSKLVEQFANGNVTMNDISTYVQNNSSPKKYQQFQRALSFAMIQAKDGNLSDSETAKVLANAMTSTEQEGVHWRSCGEKEAIESILFVAAGTLGIISLVYLHNELGQNGNMSQAAQNDQQSKSQALSTYQNAAPNALTAANQDQVNINGDNAKIATLQSQINSTPSSQTSVLSNLNQQLASSQAQLGQDQAAYTTDMSNYNNAISTYTNVWLQQQDGQADAQLIQQNAQYQQAQVHDTKVAQITGIIAGALAAAGTAGAFSDGHCDSY